MRRNPYAPTFDSTPGQHRDHRRGRGGVGAGIQACSGKAGIFTRNASAKHRKIHSCVPSDSGAASAAVSSNVTWPPSGVARMPVATAAASISRLPTSV